jgi:hypothetical protein
MPRLGAPREASGHTGRQLARHVNVQAGGREGRMETREHAALARQPCRPELSEAQPESRLLAGEPHPEDHVVASADQDATQRGRGTECSTQVGDDLIDQAGAIRVDGDSGATAQPPERRRGQAFAHPPSWCIGGSRPTLAQQALHRVGLRIRDSTMAAPRRDDRRTAASGAERRR